MKRLICKYEPKVNDKVKFKKHPYDKSTYVVKEIFDNGNVFIDNGSESFTDVNTNSLVYIGN